MTKYTILTAVTAAAAASAAGAATVSNTTPTVTYDFQSFAGSGFAPNPSAGQLDSDDVIATGFSDAPNNLAFGGTATSGDFARGTSTGNVSTGGVYAFDVGGDIGLGVQPGGSDFAPGTFVFAFTNTGSTAITDLAFDTTLFVRNDQARANSFNLRYSTDSTVDGDDVLISGYTSPAAAGTGAAANFAVAPGAGDGTLGGLSIAPGTTFYAGFRGQDVSGSGSRDEFSIGSFAVTATFTPVPEPLTAGAAGLMGLVALRRRRA